MRYYCVKHHINQGDYPRKHLVDEIKNFDEPTYIEEIGQEALAYIDYAVELTREEAMVYDLIEPEHKNFWCVMTTFDEDGNILSNMVNVAQAVNKPKDHVLSSRDERIGMRSRWNSRIYGTCRAGVFLVYYSIVLILMEHKN